MSTFEFLFSLFGLLLGFSIAEIAGGFSRMYDRRKTQPIGWLAPGLAALLIADILTFWYSAWFLRDMDLKFWMVLGAAVIGLMYYFAASQVFPREDSDVSASGHVMARRKEIAGAVAAANTIMFAPAYVQLALAGGAVHSLPEFWIGLVYLGLMSVIAFARPVWIVVAAVFAALLMIVVMPVAMNY